MKNLLLFLLLLMASSASGEIYRWRDGAGVFHFSNSLDDVPLRYREKVKVMNYDQPQKGGAAPSQIAPQVVPSATPVVTQPPATGISPPQRADGRTDPGREERVLQRQRRGGGRPASETREDE